MGTGAFIWRLVAASLTATTVVLNAREACHYASKFARPYETRIALGTAYQRGYVRSHF